MRITLYTSVSLNGMIARQDGSGDYFTDICWHGCVDAARAAGGLIFGRRTYDMVRSWGSFRRDLVGQSVRGVVLTGNPTYAVEPAWETAGSPQEALAKLAARGIGGAVVAGGTTVYTEFLRQGLADDITLLVESVIVGTGLPVFAPIDLEMPCRLVDARRLTETVARLDYALRP